MRGTSAKCSSSCLPFPVTSFVSVSRPAVGTTTQTQKAQYREGRAASQACYLLPTMCPPQNSKCNVTWPSNAINSAPHLPTTINVKMKIHAPKTKHSKDVGDTCNSSASKKAQVYGPTLLSHAGATSNDVTWRKTFSQGA